MDCEEKRVANQESTQNQHAEQTAVSSSGIYCYIKDHPGSLAAMLSATVAIVSFVLHAALYRRTSAYLRYWGFNADNINIEHGSQIYVVAMAFVFCLAMGGLSWFLCQTFHVFQKRANVLLYLRSDNRYTCREILKLRVGMFGVSLGVRFYRKKGASQKQIEEIRANLAEQKKRLDELSARIKSRCRTLWLLRLTNVVTLLPSLLIAYGLLFLLISLTGVSEELKASMRSPAAALSIVVLLLMGFVYCLVRFEFRAERRKIQKAFKKDYESAYMMIEELVEQGNEPYPVVHMIKAKVEELLSNRTIAFVALLLVVSLVFAFSVCSVADKKTTNEKTTFSVVNVDGQEYIITYTFDTTYYLNEVEINYEENAITVSKENQRVIVAEDIRYTIVQFKSVKIEPAQEG